MSEMYMAKRVVDSTAPWGRPAGVFLGADDASFKRTENECPVRNAPRMQIDVCVKSREVQVSSREYCRQTFVAVTWNRRGGVYRVLVGKPEGKRPLGRPRRRWVDNIRMDLQEVGCGHVEWIGLAQDRDRWRTLVSAAMNLRVP